MKEGHGQGQEHDDVEEEEDDDKEQEDEDEAKDEGDIVKGTEEYHGKGRDEYREGRRRQGRGG